MATDAFEEFVVGHGELWCAQLTAAKCRQLGADSAFMDARDVLVVRPTADGNSVDVEYEVRAKEGGGGGTRAREGCLLRWAHRLVTVPPQRTHMSSSACERGRNSIAWTAP